MHETTKTPQLKSQHYGGTIWLDIENAGRDTFEHLEHEYNLHPVHLKESVQKVQHTRVEREDHYLFFVLHIPVLEPRTDKIVISQVGVFLGKNYLITIRSGSCPPLTALFAACEQQTREREECFKQGSGYLLYMFITRLLTYISDMIEGILNELDEIEDLVFDNNESDAQRIGKVRQKIVRLSRIIGPKRFILQDLTEQIDHFTGHRSLSRYYSTTTKTANKLWEVIEEAKETVEIYKDADFTTSTEQTNEILAILTILFTFTIPITVVGTLYGMNVPLPGGIAAGAWTFLGPYTSFEILVTGSVLMAVIMYLYFRRKKWF